MKITCKQCNCVFDASGARGRTPSYCSGRCRLRAFRARQVPKVMREARRWSRADGKRPVMVNGRPASSTNPATWACLDDVKQGAGDGFGFMLGGGIGCYDLDYALSGGKLKPWAKKFIKSIREKVIFTEMSVSGAGVHVFVLMGEQRGSRRVVGDGRVECYSQGRFIRCGVPLAL